jgi:hypothetical protein
MRAIAWTIIATLVLGAGLAFAGCKMEKSECGGLSLKDVKKDGPTPPPMTKRKSPEGAAKGE